MTDLDKLEALAKAATPGEWEPVSISGYGSPFSIRMAYHSDNPNAPKTHYGIQSVRTREDTHFIAAANPATILDLIASARRDAEEIERLREALTPSGATKAAYHGEFKFTQYGRDDDGDDYSYETYVPWTTVKEIMAAIRARAAHTGEG